MQIELFKKFFSAAMIVSSITAVLNKLVRHFARTEE